MEDSEAIVINKYTGEVLCNNPVKWISKAQDEAKSKWKESNMKFQNDNFDSFIWFVYNPLQKIFPELNGAEIARLIVLATYIDYNDGYLFLNRRNYLTISKVPKVLNLCEKKSKSFIKKLSLLNIIKIEDNKICMNKEIFYKGKINYETNKETIRLYIKYIRELYKQCPARQHKKLAYIFKLIPWINKKYNVVCRNIHETDIAQLEVLPLEEISVILGYDENSNGHIYDLFKDLSKIEYDGEKVFCYMSPFNKSKSMIFINPKLYYSGSDNEIIIMLRKLFELNR